MKIVTGNDLLEGAPVYRTAAGGWTRDIAQAAAFENGAAEVALAAAQKEETIVVGVYLLAMDDVAKPAHREKVREDIRAKGPTVPYGDEAERS
jgi:hypothetical protein